MQLWDINLDLGGDFMHIEEKVVEEEQLALINHRGAPEDMGKLIYEISAWAEDNKITLSGPPFAIYYTSPQDNAEDIVYDIGFPVAGEVVGNERIIIANVPEHKVVYALHKGPYADIPLVYQSLVEFVMINKYDVIGSPKEIYFNSPEEVSASELLTEVQFPVIKM
jgi:effector-binding domain-containing protein